MAIETVFKDEPLFRGFVLGMQQARKSYLASLHNQVSIPYCTGPRTIRDWYALYDWAVGYASWPLEKPYPTPADLDLG